MSVLTRTKRRCDSFANDAKQMNNRANVFQQCGLITPNNFWSPNILESALNK